ncbi:XAP5-domain-containing protein [Xylaria bambusicola]|uniref:XAP5-domain-containing protein n=1 Tax=Xylaria bambusicola TaxID=326684 RepID=UPI002007C1B2|nr:XAP5-domain-containing protein [Xylaria bambusicola]KAI0508714.1 XAP5-domain-containing protein [Xylaria bambusicola]
MASDSRFTSQNKTTQQRISNNTVGLVALSDFRKRRAEVLEQQEREAREAALSGSPISTPTPDRSLTSTPDPASDPAAPPKKRKKKRNVGVKLSFGNDEDENEGGNEEDKGATDARNVTPGKDEGTPADKDTSKAKFKVNSSVSVVPRAVTKSALRREAAERDLLRREFLQRQERVKAAEIAIPFVFYDGSNIPGGTVRVKKGDFVWQFLDKSRKVGADLGVGEKANARREWARVGVDDLMMVRGNVIIPHHYDFLFFIMNKTLGPNGTILFKYDADASIPLKHAAAIDDQPLPINTPLSATSTQAPTETLEGASDDPTMTRVVDRRWYERNKHIYPASMWQDFDPEKDYQKEVRRDTGGNTFFYS